MYIMYCCINMINVNDNVNHAMTMYAIAEGKAEQGQGAKITTLTIFITMIQTEVT